MKRLCSMCRQAKDETDFRHRKGLGTRHTYCSNCQKLYNKEYLRIYRERKKNENI